MQIKVLIADDEALARDVIRVYLADYPQVEIVGEAKDGKEAVELIENLKPDLVFLDIQMPEADGFAVVRKIQSEKMPFFIFVSAFDQYALKAFEVNASDYLLKPFDKERFNQSFQKILYHLDNHQSLGLYEKMMDLVNYYEKIKEQQNKENKQESAYITRFLIKQPKRYFFLKVADIEWIEAAGDYVKLHAGKDAYLINDSMNRLENKLNPENFVRIHRSSIVNLDAIKEFQPYFNGEFILSLKDGTQLKLSRNYREKAKIFLGENRE